MFNREKREQRREKQQQEPKSSSSSSRQERRRARRALASVAGLVLRVLLPVLQTERGRLVLAAVLSFVLGQQCGDVATGAVLASGPVLELAADHLEEQADDTAGAPETPRNPPTDGP